MKNNRQIKLTYGKMSIFLIGTLLLTIVACAPPPSPYADANPDYVNLLDSGPCWKNICPRETPLQDALTILSTLEIGNSASIKSIPNKNAYAMSFIPERFGTSTVRLTYLDRVILRIRLSISANELSLSQIVDYFGFPTWVSSSNSCGYGDNVGYTYGFNLWYEDKGVTVISDGLYAKEESTMVKLDPKYSIGSLIYHSPSITPEQWIRELGGEVEDLGPLYTWGTWNDFIPIEPCQDY